MTKPYYLDSSVLVKKYIEEDGTPFVQSLFLGDSFFYTSCLTYPEAYAALNRLGRTGFLTSDKKVACLTDLEKDWGGFAVVDYSESVHKCIPEITGLFSLSGADSVHLAAAAHLKKNGIDLTFLTSDIRLLNAAADYGLKTINPASK